MSAPRATLTEGDVTRALRSLAVPMMLGIVFILAVNLIDTYFVGQLGTAELAAMSFTFPVVSLVMSVAMGIGVGATSAVSRAIGGGDEHAVRRLATHALLLAVLIVALVSGVGILTQRPVFAALGADPSLLPLLDEYMTIWYAGAVFLVVPMVLNGILRASGDARTPALIMMLAALANLILDPIFIFGFGPVPRLGLEGAAIATLLARAITLVITIYIVGVRMKLLDARLPSARAVLHSWRQIVGVGIPAAITNALAPLAAALLTAIVATEGSAAVAGFGIGGRVEGMLLIAPMALSAALMPFIGQNFGGQHLDRVAESLRIARRFVLLWGLGAWLVLLLTAPLIAAAFTDDPVVIAAAKQYLWLVPLAYGAHGLVSVASAAFNAVDRALRSTLLSATRSLLLAVPLAWLGGQIAGLSGVFAGLTVATVIAGGLALWWLRGLSVVPDPTAVAAGEAASAEALSRTTRDTKDVIDSLLDNVLELADITVRARPVNTLGFYLGSFEIGHIHRSGHLDVRLPPPIHDWLLAHDLVEHHRHVHEASWVSLKVDDAPDVDRATWLLTLAQTFGRLRREVPTAQRDLAAMSLPPELSEHMVACAARCRQAAAANPAAA